MEKIKDTLRALQVMSERGTENERRIASQKLSILLKKYDLSLADIIDGKKEVHWFSYRTKYEKQLLHQIHYKVTSWDDDSYYQAKGQTKIGYELTPLEAAEMGRFFEHWKVKLSEEFEVCYEAFIQANKIFGEGDPGGEDGATLDLKKLRRVLSMADTMTGSSPLIQLPENSC